MTVEHRKHSRNMPGESIYAALGENKTIIGKVRDICFGGLAIDYLGENDDKQSYQRLDIFTLNNSFFMSGLPCQVVYDVSNVVENDEKRSPGVIRNKRCGLKFGGLTHFQRTKLELFLGEIFAGNI